MDKRTFPLLCGMAVYKIYFIYLFIVFVFVFFCFVFWFFGFGNVVSDIGVKKRREHIFKKKEEKKKWHISAIV